MIVLRQSNAHRGSKGRWQEVSDSAVHGFACDHYFWVVLLRCPCGQFHRTAGTSHIAAGAALWGGCQAGDTAIASGCHLPIEAVGLASKDRSVCA